jgi:hypothetical protein
MQFLYWLLAFALHRRAGRHDSIGLIMSCYPERINAVVCINSTDNSKDPFRMTLIEAF